MGKNRSNSVVARNLRANAATRRRQTSRAASRRRQTRIHQYDPTVKTTVHEPTCPILHGGPCSC